ncbi:MAG TPA: hypothetical protein VFV30_05040 [Novosphingobium sp.]|nr:hypothetical protein [Novosphingobium sp.]
MNQSDRMNSASNGWEADPWDASDAVADLQLEGFQIRAAKAVSWSAISLVEGPIFGHDIEWLNSLEVEYVATHDLEDWLLMRLVYHGFPDPPEWRLATRAAGKFSHPWNSWGYFAQLPDAWKIPGI